MQRQPIETRETIALIAGVCESAFARDQALASYYGLKIYATRMRRSWASP